MNVFARNTRLFMLLLAVFSFVTACKKDKLETISGFSYEVDASNFLKVYFTNTSQNYTSLSWDFGDGSPTSSETNPTHTYAAAGSYTVALTATGADGTDRTTVVVNIVDPNAELTKLTGGDSKTWKLLRVVAPGVWPLEVGPIDHSVVWWAQGRDNDEIALRPCIMNDEFIFYRDGRYEYKTNGDFWAEGGVFDPANECRSSAAGNMTGPNGTDLSAFGDGVHAYTFNPAAQTLTVTGLGAFIGLPKIGTDREVSTPQPSVTYQVLKLTDGPVDTLVLNVNWKFADNTSGLPDAYWRMVLVHYDNAAEEPALSDPKPQPDFTSEVEGLTIKFTNSSKYSDSYSWDFGDGATSNETNPTHTYASGGIYVVKLTATNAVGSVTTEREFTLSTGTLTAADLIGAPWKIRAEANSVYVGPGLGDPSWWQVPVTFWTGGGNPTEDWSCMINDEFIFSAGGVYEYKTNGDARNDGYMGAPNGCITDAQLAASGNGAAFGSAVHSWSFTPASGSARPVITLTNGPTGAAFVGFYKGYYGGENTDPANAPNGGQTTNRYEVISYVKTATSETLILSVDISAAHDGSAAWTVVLVR
jgi:PKD repeat protein